MSEPTTQPMGGSEKKEQPQITPDTNTSRIEQHLYRWGRIRDGIIVFAGLMYILGYGVWEYNAWKNKLGILPALQWQYFMAGSILVLSIIICAGVFFILISLMNKYEAWVNGITNNISEFIFRTLPMIFVMVAMLYLFCKDINFFVIYIISLASYIAAIIKFDNEIHSRLPFIQKDNVVFLAPSAFTCIVAISQFYLSFIYPSIPQELGGTHPRSAYLDVRRYQLSQEKRNAILPIRSRILPNGTGKDIMPVVETVELDVYYDSSDFLLVRPHGKNRNTPIYRIPKDVLESVTWE